MTEHEEAVMTDGTLSGTVSTCPLCNGEKTVSCDQALAYAQRLDIANTEHRRAALATDAGRRSYPRGGSGDEIELVLRGLQVGLGVNGGAGKRVMAVVEAARNVWALAIPEYEPPDSPAEPEYLDRHSIDPIVMACLRDALKALEASDA